MTDFNQKGLTLLELLIAITIIMVTITTVLVLGDRSVLQAESFSRSRQAAFLAKEGVELISDIGIRNDIRGDIEEDEEWGGFGFWAVEYNGSVSRLEGQECKEIMANDQGFYDHGNLGAFTPFSRCITVWALNRDDKLKTRISVFFEQRGEEKYVTVYRIFYD